MAVQAPRVTVSADSDHITASVVLRGDPPDNVVLWRRRGASGEPVRLADLQAGEQTSVPTSWELSGDTNGPRDGTSTSTHIYVPSPANRRVHAYTLAGDRDQSEDYVLVNYHCRGIAFVGTDLYAVDDPADGQADSRVYVYTDQNGTRDSSKEFALPSANGSPNGLGISGTSLYIPDNDGHIYVHQTDGSSTAAYALATDNTAPRGCHVDGTNLYVCDRLADRVFVYDLSDRGSPAGSVALGAGNTDPRGITKQADWYVVNARAGTGDVFVYPQLSATAIADFVYRDYFAASGVDYQYQAAADGAASAWVS